jgi:hypothetical protein
MKIIRTQTHISIDELKQLAKVRFGILVKAVVDIKKESMAVDAEFHADQEQALIADGSSSMDLWGINLYPEQYGAEGWIEFDSMINLKPHLNNRSRGVEDQVVRQKIAEIDNQLVTA